MGNLYFSDYTSYPLFLEESKVLNLHHKLLQHISCESSQGEFIKINHGKIADDLEIAKTDVSRSIRKLINNEIIEPLNSDNGWKINIRLHPHTYEDDEKAY